MGATQHGGKRLWSESARMKGGVGSGGCYIGVQRGLHVFSVPTTDSILIQDERGNFVEASNLLR